MCAAGAILAVAGYWGPWVAHKAAALVIPGLDLAEYVKFLPEYRAGEILIWREGFYLPLVALSLTLSTLAWQPRMRWPSALRVIAWLASIPLALSMLPPAWSPAVLRLPEFRLQMIAIAVCLAVTLLAPLAREKVWAWAGWILGALCLAAAIVPVWQFWIMRTALDHAYGRAVTVGWGPAVMAGGFVLIAIFEVAMSASATVDAFPPIARTRV